MWQCNNYIVYVIWNAVQYLYWRWPLWPVCISWKTGFASFWSSTLFIGFWNKSSTAFKFTKILSSNLWCFDTWPYARHFGGGSPFGIETYFKCTCISIHETAFTCMYSIIHINYADVCWGWKDFHSTISRWKIQDDKYEVLWWWQTLPIGWNFTFSYWPSTRWIFLSLPCTFYSFCVII